MSPMLLIDGDVLVYQSCPPRVEDKLKRENDKLVRELNEDGTYKDVHFTEDENTIYLHQSWRNFRRKVDKLCNKFWTNEYMMAVGTRMHYRSDMYPDYKVHRNKKKVEGKFVPILRQKAVYKGLAVYACDREADDYIRTWAEECRLVGREYIVCSIDKDLKCIPGKHYNFNSDKLEVVSEEDAMRFYYEQLLSGDQVDHIPGLPGIGPKKAKGLVEHCTTEEEYRGTVIALYQAFYDDEWKDYLLSNGKMIHIQRNLNDFFTLKEWE